MRGLAAVEAESQGDQPTTVRDPLHSLTQERPDEMAVHGVPSEEAGDSAGRAVAVHATCREQTVRPKVGVATS